MALPDHGGISAKSSDSASISVLVARVSVAGTVASVGLRFLNPVRDGRLQTLAVRGFRFLTGAPGMSFSTGAVAGFSKTGKSMGGMSEPDGGERVAAVVAGKELSVGLDGGGFFSAKPMSVLPPTSCRIGGMFMGALEDAIGEGASLGIRRVRPPLELTVWAGLGWGCYWVSRD